MRTKFWHREYDPTHWDRVRPSDDLEWQWTLGMRALTRYNTERGRGLVHTYETDRDMRAWQRLFDEQRRDRSTYARWRIRQRLPRQDA